MSTESAPERDQSPPTLTLCPGGPMIVRGDVVVQDEDGVRHQSHRGVSAVCRCGKSALAPWCDGTHKLLPGGR